MAGEAMDAVRRAEFSSDGATVRRTLGSTEPKTLRQLMWGMRLSPLTWRANQACAMHWLQRSTLKSGRAWRPKMSLREVYARAKVHDDSKRAGDDLRTWLNWARRSRLEAFKKLIVMIRQHFDAVVRGMLEHRSDAFVEAMNGLL